MLGKWKNAFFSMPRDSGMVSYGEDKKLPSGFMTSLRLGTLSCLGRSSSASCSSPATHGSFNLSSSALYLVISYPDEILEQHFQSRLLGINSSLLRLEFLSGFLPLFFSSTKYCSCTLIKKKKKFHQNGAVAKSYMTNGLLIYGAIFAHFLLYQEALPQSHI